MKKDRLLRTKKIIPHRLRPSFADQIAKREKVTTSPSVYQKSLNLREKNGKDQSYSHWKVVPFYLALMIIFSVILLRSWQLQVIKGKKYRVLAEENRIRFQITDAPRGIIYDRNGEVLARNIPGVKVYWSPYGLSEEARDKVISILSPLIDKSEQEIKELLTEGERKSLDKIVLKSSIDHETEIELLSRKDELPGVFLEEGIIREYREGEKFAHLIGYTGELTENELNSVNYQNYFLGERIGRTGLEAYYEKELKGIVGQKLIEVDANGEEKELLYETKPLSGKGLVLNIDYSLQAKVYDVLKAAIGKYKATGAVGILADTNNGKILSLVSLPSYDNNIFAQGISSSDLKKIQEDPGDILFNRVISGAYPSGSTIKPLVAAAALEEGTITEKTLFNDTGAIAIGSYRFPDWKASWGLPPNGQLNVIEALSQSCDTFFYAVGGGYGSQGGLGMERLQKYAKEFGFSSLSGIDLPGENEGLYPSEKWKEETKGESWYLGDTYWVSIGQSYVLTTPLQINNYISAVANGGILYKPQIVSRVVDSNQKTIFQKQPEILNEDFIAVGNLEIVKEGMRKGVNEGIIWPLRTAKYQVAAKTGTAEFGQKDIHGHYETHAWVTGFFPYDKPEISFTILLEAGGQSSNAAEVVKEIIDWYYDEYHK